MMQFPRIGGASALAFVEAGGIVGTLHMGIFADIIQALLKGFFGESANEKHFRSQLGDAERMFDMGWQYRNADDLRKSVELATGLTDNHAPTRMMAFQKYRLVARSYIKLTAIAKEEYEHHMSEQLTFYRRLQNLDVTAMEAERSDLQAKIAQTEQDIVENKAKVNSRKLEKILHEHEANLIRQRRQLATVSETLGSLVDIEHRVKESEDTLRRKMDECGNHILQSFGIAKDLTGLNPEESTRRALLLKNHWNELKQIQESIGACVEKFRDEMPFEGGHDTPDSHDESGDKHPGQPGPTPSA